MMKRWLMIADAHLTCRTAEDEFFAMLDYAASLPEDVGVIFLGDIFDLWIALPGYETPEQRKFLAWCSRQKFRRPVVFLEGNHEFYVAKTYASDFSFCGEDSYQDGLLQWMHGDRINRADHAYTALRFVLRSALTRSLLRIFGSTIGPRVAHYVRERLRTTNLAHKKYFPHPQALRLLTDCPAESTVFVGHFHDRLTESYSGRILEVLPAYAAAAEVAFYDPSAGNLSVVPARRLPDFFKTHSAQSSRSQPS